MHKHQTFDKHTTAGHAFFLYNDTQERVDLLARYFEQGIAHNELCIFVTSDSVEDALKGFLASGFDASVPFSKGDLRIFEMNPTYLPEGRFIADYMLNNVKSFIEDAKTAGYSGLRTAGEMCWLTEHPEAMKEAHTYERDVNGLNTPDPEFVGLCLYPVRDSSSALVDTAIRTHPSFIYDGHVQSNPYYQPA